MAYHEAYWVVIGTASPVIALAAIVADSHLTASSRSPQYANWFLTSCLLAEILGFVVALSRLAAQSDGPLWVMLFGAVATIAGIIELAVGSFLGRRGWPTPDAEGDEAPEDVAPV